MPNLLFEIGTEELPAGYIRPALRQMESLISGRLKDARLSFKKIYAAGTPRRLAVFAEDVSDKQESIEEEVTGPSCKAAFDADNNPTNAGKGFAKFQGINVEELKIKETKKGRYCYAIKRLEGEQTIRLLPEILIGLIKSIDFPKKMIWKGRDVSFARPIRSLTAIFGADVIDFELNGVRSGRTVMGNPYITAPETYGIGRVVDLGSASFEAYKQKLLKENVVVDIDDRKAALKQKVCKILSNYNSMFDDEDLLEELTNLVEFPTAIECGFEETFLDLPDEVIIAAMKGHQRYCPVIDQDGRLYPKFVAVLNKDEKGAEKARDGNERVLRARLADARFFLEEDKKLALCDRVKGLKDMVFHGKLGSYMDRTNRIINLADFIARKIGGSDSLIEDAKRAAFLCKADLITSMVGEFPELQGIMGREYARYSGESDKAAAAIEEHYLPRFANDKLPETEAGTVVSLADKFDMISGCFSIGLIPTGSQDPFALRRSAQGIIRIIERRALKISINEMINKALALFPEQSRGGRGQERTSLINDSKLQTGNDLVQRQILDFFKDRLYHTFIDRGYRHDIINAAIASGFDDIVDLSQRLQIILEMSTESFWSDLVTVVERTFNISKNQRVDAEIKEDMLVEPEEKTLWDIYLKSEGRINSFIGQKDYKSASIMYSEIFTRPVHIFFDKVFVNVEDEKLRSNRLMMLKKINKLYSSRIADLSLIVME